MLTLTCGFLQVSTSASHSITWCTSFLMALEGSPILYCYGKGKIGCGNERAVIGHFQKARMVGKFGYGCMVCCQTLDNLIRDLLSYLS